MQEIEQDKKRVYATIGTSFLTSHVDGVQENAFSAIIEVNTTSFEKVNKMRISYIKDVRMLSGNLAEGYTAVMKNLDGDPNPTTIFITDPQKMNEFMKMYYRKDMHLLWDDTIDAEKFSHISDCFEPGYSKDFSDILNAGVPGKTLVEEAIERVNAKNHFTEKQLQMLGKCLSENYPRLIAQSSDILVEEKRTRELIQLLSSASEFIFNPMLDSINPDALLLSSILGLRASELTTSLQKK